MKKISFVLVVLVTFLGILPITYAQEINKRGACKTDYEKFCKDVQPGQGRIINCLKANEAKLSPDCSAYFKK